MKSAKSKVITYAANRNVQLNDWGDDGYWVVEGSTIVYITFPIIDDNLKTEMVSIFSIVVRNVRVDNVLMSKLLNLNTRMSFGAFAIEDDMVIYKYNLLGGEHIDEDEFFNALLMVAIISDEYDNKIISTHGGITAVDFVIEHIRKEEGKSLSW
jgi:hypothetical protein